ncbi:ATP-binding protein [Desulfogranum mediterraneum]|uniref:ATP-binding protein n=1 Tax=Desulfogranum mediterraneum TaxID=160661 RepID=UPI00137855C1|nr:ATP-binding protein [Desulfogranum mediterraneum]
MKYGIFSQLITGFGAIGSIVIIIFALANHTIEATTGVLQDTVSSQLEILAKTNLLLFQANQIRVMESELNQLNDFYAVSGILEQLGEVSDAFEAELNSFSTNEFFGDREHASRLLSSWQAYRLDLDRIILLAGQAMNRQEITRISTYSSSPRFQIFSQQLQQISVRVQSEGSEQFQRSILTLTTMRHTFLLMAFVSITAGILFAFFLAKSMSRRIGGLSNAALLLAENKLGDPLPVEGKDELADLASVFNVMQDKITHRESMLKRAQEKLEERVEGRTRELAERTRELEDQARELIKARNEAVFANQAKSSFLSNMSHELRTPLNAILGFAQVLQEESSLSHQQREQILTIHKSGSHLLTLISDILDMAKIEASRLELVPSTIPLHNFLWSIVNMIGVCATPKGIELNCTFDSELPGGIVADEQRLRQVLFNLLGNAVKFTHEGEVSFSVCVIAHRRQAPHHYTLRFEIADTGIGIPEESQEAIFTAFEQVGGLGEKGKGTGLGLAISQRLIQEMESRIHLASNPGQGSTFWFDLAVTSIEIEPEVVCHQSNIAGYHGPTREILLVDDCGSNRALLVDLLAPLKFRLVEASNGQDAIRVVAQNRPDLILLDMVMPGMDGQEAARKIRTLPGCQALPIIALSAHVDQGDKERGLAAGCSLFLEKPFHLQDLLELIGESLELKWKYLQDPAPGAEGDRRMAIPDEERLAEVYRLALYGNMRKIRDWARSLVQEDSRYSAFAHRLTELAGSYQEENIIALIRQHLREELQ